MTSILGSWARVQVLARVIGPRRGGGPALLGRAVRSPARACRGGVGGARRGLLSRLRSVRVRPSWGEEHRAHSSASSTRPDMARVQEGAARATTGGKAAVQRVVVDAVVFGALRV
jgi:hypothetical protein